MSKSTVKTNYSALLTLCMVFFFWGFIAAGNSIFIPFCKHFFGLNHFQSQLVDFAFYFAYFMGAVILYYITYKISQDPIKKWGYRMSIVYGLLLSALGATLMILFLWLETFAGMLFGLFVVGLGFSIQQTAANPFMIALGDEKTGSNRVSLGGGINSIGGTLGPLLVGLALFGSTKFSTEEIPNLNLSKVILLYVFVGLLFLSVAALFYMSKKLPNDEMDGQREDASELKNGLKTLVTMTVVIIGLIGIIFFLDNITILDPKNREILQLISLLSCVASVFIFLFTALKKSKKQKNGWGALAYPQLVWGMTAIFIYVGVEVATGSNLSDLISSPNVAGIDTSETAKYVSLYWGSLMMGRWASAVYAFNLSKTMSTILTIVMPFLGFGFVYYFNTLNGGNYSDFWIYFFFIAVLIIGFFIGKNKPALTLAIFGALSIICLTIGIIPSAQLNGIAFLIGLSSGSMITIYAIIATGLFCSIMWPCIFSLSLAGLGKHTSQGSAFLVMMILGGAIIPPLQGKLADIFGIQHAYLVGIVCFCFLLVYAITVRKILRKQNISLE